MDTREKIVPLDSLPAQAGGPWLAVAGRFDPLTLEQAERLAGLRGRGKKILAVVEPAEDTLLPAEARAVLVAALRSVDLVVIADAAALRSYPQIEILEDAAGERRRSREFRQLVARRHGAR